MTTHSRTSARPPMLRDLNERTVLEAIRARPPVSRAEISRRVGISKPTVSLALRSLLDAGLVREADGDAFRPRYGATFFEPVPDAALVLGLDVGARFLRGAICDLRGDVRARQDIEAAGADAVELLDAAAELKTRLVDASELPTGAIDGVVVGVPGVVHPRHRGVRLAENVPGLEGLEVARELEARLGGIPVTVENDVNLAAVGERWRGVGRGVADFAVLSVGTGLGAGLVIDGELHRGRHGAAGELDFALSGGQSDPSAPAISVYAEQLAGEGEEVGSLRPPFDVPAIFEAARAGEVLACAVVQEEARRIAMHIAPIAAVADVELVVLGGGIGTNGDLLLAPTREHLADLLPYPPRVDVSSLGDAAVLTGALAVGLRAALDNVFVNRGTRSRAGGAA
jgi:predicted NBD/HSP70 family sugar kinase